MKLRILAISDKGCVRENNEDMILIDGDIFRDDKRDLTIDLEKVKRPIFIAIADGMGGHNAGEVASEIVLKKMAEKMNVIEENLDENTLNNIISEYVKDVHKYILDEGNKDIYKRGMGSTLIGVLFYNNTAYYMNVGDSRLYRFRNGNLMQISRDHSLKELTGKDTPSNIIINSFGGSEKIFVDFSRVGGKLIDNDILLLCSDGLYDMISDDEIENLLACNININMLLRCAKEKGGEDNISIVLIHLIGGE